ncbi:DUF4240 domain-containing protein [Anatilimnocola floriformis]|uniref:DUF4240 domain-containing protein n=1 Tax=Anatilimnocola floriformis TaxID=2948575 RepID=UPI0020C41EC0|nr:DUF4240 domain-containing protein [Anatilimnocola floriformis]
MDLSKFWKIIAAGGREAQDDPDEKLQAIEEKLAKCSPEDLVSFQTLLDERMVEAYTVDLWGAAYLLNGGCSDDGFHYFCLWLISRGQKKFEAAVAQPDSLSRLADPDNDEYELEELGYLAPRLYEEAVGKEIPRSKLKWPKRPKGENWDYDNTEEVHARLPKLAAIYLEE